MSYPFLQCLDRVERAKTHRETAGKLWNAFVADNPYESTLEIDDEGKGSIWIEQTKPLPPELPFIFGECLYQLRAALDSCVYEAVCLQTGQRPPANEQNLEFVIRDSRSAFDKARWKLSPLSLDRQAVIEKIQPYNAPKLEDSDRPFNYNRGIAILNDWARRDRHRKLHVVAMWADNVNPLLWIPKDTGIRLVDFEVPAERFVFKNQHEVANFKLAGHKPGTNIRANPNLSFDVLIDEAPLPCHPKDTLENRLHCMTVAVVEVIAEMAMTFAAQFPAIMRN